MKLYTFIFAILFSLSALANVDLLIGKYRAKGASGEARISKEIVEEATLFTPAKYRYVLNAESDKDDLWVEQELELSPDGKSLQTSWSGGDCDNPDCHELTELDITVKKDGRMGAKIIIKYIGFDRADGSDEETEFSGTAVFVK